MHLRLELKRSPHVPNNYYVKLSDKKFGITTHLIFCAKQSLINIYVFYNCETIDKHIDDKDKDDDDVDSISDNLKGPKAIEAYRNTAIILFHPSGSSPTISSWIPLDHFPQST